ncbi:versatile peroxidase VPS1 [Epithele typhae]|uniref:versatile peroxidase VPS1 n=1 Tax=Epithele typhae TaxID=378194 RepID=UPI0020086140|nr:versatile peroxidase VPS1 [Epithele typhae]KAH9942492.1 versatile peroxidase VPS1 [Epithele typhae]
MPSSTLKSLVVLAPLVTIATAALTRFPRGYGTEQTKCKNGCCVWYEMLDDVQANLFDGGMCGEEAHESLRLTFHDAIGYSHSQGSKAGGGADGSIMKFTDIELMDPANGGTDDIMDLQRPFAWKYNVSYADIIQFLGAVGVNNCAGGPRLRFFAGRSNETIPAALGLVPKPEDSVDMMLARMHDAGFSPKELVALLASHTVAAQDGINSDFKAHPLDSTPSTFDRQFFVETLLKGVSCPDKSGKCGKGEAPTPLVGEIRLASDGLLARDPRTACYWQAMIVDHSVMIHNFTTAMHKLSLVGQDESLLTDCSEVIPHPQVMCSCPTPFPKLETMPGPALMIASVPK